LRDIARMLGFSEATSLAIRALEPEDCLERKERQEGQEGQEGLEGLEGQEGLEGRTSKRGGFRLQPEDQCRRLSSA
jgi:hypothetical protein